MDCWLFLTPVFVVFLLTGYAGAPIVSEMHGIFARICLKSDSCASTLKIPRMLCSTRTRHVCSKTKRAVVIEGSHKMGCMIVVLATLISIREVLSLPRVRLVPKIHGIWPCPAHLNHFTEIYNYSIGLDENGMERLNVDGKIHRKIITVTKFAITMHRCRGGVSAGNCEYFSNWNWERGCCAIIATRGVPWTPIVDSISPTFQCPMDQIYIF
ncbi:uncharacterized protein LOC117653775 isoform X3 [Thrips palmi]|uniref:Uncharacterized protein LOC117653775 isoform X3 n=1 Tax=Thrips palmi TaxID=161013 RepID=A0A6P9ABR0_THRPL|nr:uncharacterized protein LOC117653775 isoform X3 [Thrips palmi]